MKETRLNLTTPLSALTVDDKAWNTVPVPSLLWMFQQMLLIRTFEQNLLALKEKNLINGPVHASVGQEAVAVGAAMAVRRQDKFCGTHRAHHQYLAKAFCACTPDNYNPTRDGLTEAMQAHVLTLLKEIMGLADGCSGGRGGSMHLFNAEIGIAGTNAIVGGGVPPATGVAWADKMLGRDQVTLSFFGDGAVYQGAVHEACNLASLWKAPIVYVIENNHYAVGTARTAGCSAPNLCQIAAAYGMPGYQVDGMDPVAVKLAVERVTRDRTQLPCVLEVDTYRHFHHAGGSPGSAFGYRTKDEEATWHERDPLSQFEARLRKRHVTAATIEHLREQAKACIAAATDKVLETDSTGATVIRDSLWPTAADAARGLRDESNLINQGEASSLPLNPPEGVSDTFSLVSGVRNRNDAVANSASSNTNGSKTPARCEQGVRRDERTSSPRICTKEIRYSDAIAAVTGRWLEQDPTVVVMGEEVANLGGGAYGATKGLADRFPGRVRNTPITEAGFCGLACGAAMNGMHPVVELMFSSFGLVAADQLFNQIGQLGHIYGGHTSVPLVVRTRVAAGLGYGAQHSMDPVALFALFPGWRILAPTTPFDYIGLFNAAMQLKSPTLLVEHHGYYADKGLIPDGPPDHVVQIGKALVRREGTVVTVLTYGWGVRLALEAATRLAEEGVSAEVLDLRTLDDASMDYDAIGQSLGKTGALVTVEEAQACNGIGPKLIRACEQRWFDALDGPAASVNAADIPLPVSRRLERFCLPNVDTVVATVRKAARRQC